MSLKTTVKKVQKLLKGLTLSELDADPLLQFAAWYKEAERTEKGMPEAMAVATASAQGRPSSRMMLLKEVDDAGFVFFTNYNSRKCEDLDVNPFVSLVFFWPGLLRQVRVEAAVEKVSQAASEAYFHSRPRGSQIGAWASKQSSVIPNREVLEEQVTEIKNKFGHEEIPLPDFWGGYRAIPDRIEFWQGRADRLHDRFRYEKSPDGIWNISRLSP